MCDHYKYKIISFNIFRITIISLYNRGIGSGIQQGIESGIQQGPAVTYTKDVHTKLGQVNDMHGNSANLTDMTLISRDKNYKIIWVKNFEMDMYIFFSFSHCFRHSKYKIKLPKKNNKNCKQNKKYKLI